MISTLLYALLLAGSALSAIDCSLPISNVGVCGGNSGYRCDVSNCCSKYGYCGKGATYCDKTAGCQSRFGACGKTTATCKKSSVTKTSTSPVKTTAAAPKCPETKKLIGNYWETWQQNTFPLYSDLTFYFTAVTSKKGFTLDADSTKALPAFVKAARRKGVRPILTIGGWTGSIYFSSLVSTASSRKSFASAIAGYLKKYSLDGVDLDWEYPNNAGIGCNQYNAQDTTNYLAFLKELRSAVGNKLITAAVPILGFTGPNGNSLLDASAFAQYFDYLTIMNYDVYGSWSDTTGPLAPLQSTCSDQKASAVDGVAYWTKAGFPACRLLLGVPSYAYAFTTTSSKLSSKTVNGRKTYIYQPKSNITPKGDASDTQSSGRDVCGNPTSGYSGTWTYDSLVSGGVLSKDGKKGLNGFTRYYDTCSQTPFLFNSKRKYFVTYEDSQSLSKKAAFAKSKGLAGLNVFHAKGLPKSIYQAMKANL